MAKRHPCDAIREQKCGPTSYTYSTYRHCSHTTLPRKACYELETVNQTPVYSPLARASKGYQSYNHIVHVPKRPCLPSLPFLPFLKPSAWSNHSPSSSHPHPNPESQSLQPPGTFSCSFSTGLLFPPSSFRHATIAQSPVTTPFSSSCPRKLIRFSSNWCRRNAS